MHPRHAVEIGLEDDAAPLGRALVPLGRGLGDQPLAQGARHGPEPRGGERCGGVQELGLERLARGIREPDTEGGDGRGIRGGHLAVSKRIPQRGGEGAQGVRLEGLGAHCRLGEVEAHGEIGNGGALGELDRGRAELGRADVELGELARLAESRDDRRHLLCLSTGDRGVRDLRASDAELEPHVGNALVEQGLDFLHDSIQTGATDIRWS